MKYRKIGPFRTSAIAYGSMPLSIEGRPDRETAIKVLHDCLLYTSDAADDLTTV